MPASTRPRSPRPHPAMVARWSCAGPELDREGTAMYGWGDELAAGLAGLREAGLYKEEGRLASPQSREITVAGKRVINFCANNYLGLADHPAVVAAARAGLDEWGFGMASVRFICGTTCLLYTSPSPRDRTR